MSKKVIITVIAIILAVLLIGGGIGAYFYFTTGKLKPVTTGTSSDGMTTLSVRFYDNQGNPITLGTVQALIGNPIWRQITYLAFDLKVSNTGAVVVHNVEPTNPTTRMGNIFSNSGNTPVLATLSVGATNVLVGKSDQTCSSDANCDTNEKCVGAPLSCKLNLDAFIGQSQPSIFGIGLKGDIYNALGVLQNDAVTSSQVSVSYNIEGESCSDGTPLNTCKTGSAPTFCKFTSGSSPSLISNCTQCGCPSADYICNADGTCSVDKCADNTPIGSFSSASGTFGALTLSSGFDTATQTRVYCKAGKVLETRCNLGLSQLCSGTMCQQACKLDYYNNNAIGCNPSSGEPSACVYTAYTGGLSACIPDCIGKASGANDGCGGTC